MHRSHMSTSALGFALHSRPLQLSMYSNESSFAGINLLSLRSCLLSRRSTAWLTIEFYKFRFFSSFSTSSSVRVDSSKFNLVCNYSTKNNAARFNTFNNSVRIFEAYSNLLSTVYLQLNNSVIFPEKYVFHMSSLLFSPAIDACYKIFGPRKKRTNIGKDLNYADYTVEDLNIFGVIRHLHICILVSRTLADMLT